MKRIKKLQKQHSQNSQLTHSVLSAYDEKKISIALDKLYELAIVDGEITALKHFLDYFLIKADKQIDIEAANDSLPNLTALSDEQIKAMVEIARSGI